MAQRPQFTVGVDSRGLTQLYRDLDAAGKEIASDFLADVKSAGEDVRAAAVSEAESFSQRIPGTIRLVSAGGRAKVKVSIRAGNKTAPHAAPFENQGRPGRFRHPVFGNKSVWVSQAAHPFLLPALIKNLDRVAKALEAVVDRRLSQHGL